MQLSLISSTANFTLNKGAALKNKCCCADNDALILVKQRLDGHAARKSLLSTSKTVVFFHVPHVFIIRLLVDLNKIQHMNCKTVYPLIPLLTLMVLCRYTSVPFLSMSCCHLHQEDKTQMTSLNLPVH